MANTYTSLHYHVIFSTKNREPWLVQNIEQRIWEIIGGVADINHLQAETRAILERLRLALPAA